MNKIPKKGCLTMSEKTREMEKELGPKLLQKRIVLFEADITEERMSTLRLTILRLSLELSEEIKILINSKGGQVVYTFPVCDLLQSLTNADTVGIVNGICASATDIVFQACKKRLATRHSLFFCHNVQLTSSLFNNIIINEQPKQKSCDGWNWQ